MSKVGIGGEMSARMGFSTDFELTFVSAKQRLDLISSQDYADR
jgi:hypothetical protein